MSNLLAPVARQRTLTDLGVVAPGAKLFTYVSGTPATPLATSSDANGTPNANPIVASAGGLFGPIYLTPNTAYKFVLQTTDGLPIWDQDPVTAPDGSVIVGNMAVSGISYLGGPSASINAQLIVGFDPSIRSGIAVQNLSAVAGGFFAVFVTQALASIGSIQQQSATTVAYNTTSDARLKDDAGPAVDLSALRAVRVHDFTWKPDGRADRGIFAQEAQAVFPRAVSPGTDDRTPLGTLAHPWMTDYSKFVADLIVGWQQHDAALAALAARLEAAGR